MRVANVENNTLNWVSISSTGALDMTHCDFRVRSARDEMRHIVGRGCKKKDKYHMEFLCELYEAQARSPLRARANIRSEYENEVCDVDHGHARDENNSGISVRVWVSRVR